MLQKRESWREADQKKKREEKNSTGEPHKEGKKGGDRREKKKKGGGEGDAKPVGQRMKRRARQADTMTMFPSVH